MTSHEFTQWRFSGTDANQRARDRVDGGDRAHRSTNADGSTPAVAPAQTNKPTPAVAPAPAPTTPTSLSPAAAQATGFAGDETCTTCHEGEGKGIQQYVMKSRSKDGQNHHVLLNALAFTFVARGARFVAGEPGCLGRRGRQRRWCRGCRGRRDGGRRLVRLGRRHSRCSSRLRLSSAEPDGHHPDDRERGDQCPYRETVTA